jgi:predicted lipoprotein with Yx(FWY)xxD motif
MRPNSRWLSLAGLAVGVALFASACSSAAATPASTIAGVTEAPATAAPAVTAAPVVTAAPAGITIGSTADATLGAYLTGQNGMTLYFFTKDTADTSNCSGTCATNWPPLTVPAGAAITGPSGATMAFATITRADGTMQVTYNHMPLYYFAGDSKAGDTTGQGKSGIWFVAPLSGVLAPAAASPAAATPAAKATAASGY